MAKTLFFKPKAGAVQVMQFPIVASEKMDRTIWRRHHDKEILTENTARKEIKSGSGYVEPPAKKTCNENRKKRGIGEALVQGIGNLAATVFGEKLYFSSPIWDLKAILNACNPITITKRLIEDYRVVKEARKQARISGSKIGEISETLSKMEIKFGGALALSEIVGTFICAPLVGSLFHYITGNAYKGVAGNVIGDYFPAVVAFQATWLTMNLDYYSKCADSFLGKIKQFYKDVMPMHVVALAAAIPAYIANVYVSSTIITGFYGISRQLTNTLPMPLVTQMVNMTIAEAIFLSLILGATLDDIVRRTGERYHLCMKKQEQKSE